MIRTGDTAMRKLLAIAAAGEAATGLLLLIYPPIIVRLLFGTELFVSGTVMSRIAGISLIALGVACWPSTVSLQALSGMLTYSVLAALYLAFIGIGGNWVGSLLWPAVLIHILLSILLLRAWLKDGRPRKKEI